MRECSETNWSLWQRNLAPKIISASVASNWLLWVNHCQILTKKFLYFAQACVYFLIMHTVKRKCTHVDWFSIHNEVRLFCFSISIILYYISHLVKYVQTGHEIVLEKSNISTSSARLYLSLKCNSPFQHIFCRPTHRLNICQIIEFPNIWTFWVTKINKVTLVSNGWSVYW